MSDTDKEELTEEELSIYHAGSITDEDQKIILDLSVCNDKSNYSYDIFIKYIDSLNM